MLFEDQFNVHSNSTGFNFDNVKRNEFLTSKGFPVPKARKTGTTIAGIIFKDGVILGADSRATNDKIVADKYCPKIHYFAPNIYCCGAGTSADCDQVTKLIASNLELHRLNTGKVVPVVVAERMLKQYLFKYQGHVGAALIMGGVDPSGPHLYHIYPHGSTAHEPYVTMGSGSIAAMSVFEERWKPNMTLEEGKKLVRDAIASGIFNDLGSGNNINICVITAEGVQHNPLYEEACVKGQRQKSYKFKRGTTAVSTVQTIRFQVEETVTLPVEPMEVQ